MAKTKQQKQLIMQKMLKSGESNIHSVTLNKPVEEVKHFN